MAAYRVGRRCDTSCYSITCLLEMQSHAVKTTYSYKQHPVHAPITLLPLMFAAQHAWYSYTRQNGHLLTSIHRLTVHEHYRAKITRKLFYRKDDRAMRPIYGCPENFRDSLTTPTATFLKFFIGFCSDWPYECAYKILKSVALPDPGIIGGTGTPKIWAIHTYAHASSSHESHTNFIEMAA